LHILFHFQNNFTDNIGYLHLFFKFNFGYILIQNKLHYPADIYSGNRVLCPVATHTGSCITWFDFLPHKNRTNLASSLSYRKQGLTNLCITLSGRCRICILAIPFKCFFVNAFVRKGCSNPSTKYSKNYVQDLTTFTEKVSYFWASHQACSQQKEMELISLSFDIWNRLIMLWTDWSMCMR